MYKTSGNAQQTSAPVLNQIKLNVEVMGINTGAIPTHFAGMDREIHVLLEVKAALSVGIRASQGRVMQKMPSKMMVNVAESNQRFPIAPADRIIPVVEVVQVEAAERVQPNVLLRLLAHVPKTN